MGLKPYQQTGVDFLKAHKRAYLADEMGLGKTVQAVVAGRDIKFPDPNPSVVVVCPASVKEHWRREWALWADGWGAPEIISWAMVARRVSGDPPDLVILDEAHYAKTPSAQRTRAALKLARSAEYAWLLSGTPMPNDPTELYAVLRALWPESITKAPGLRPMNKHQFLVRYCTWFETEYGPKVTGLTELGRTELPAILRRIMLRRKLTDVAMELPPLRVDIQYLPRDDKVETEINDMAEAGDDPELLATQRRLLGKYKTRPIASVLCAELKADPKLQMVVLYHHRNTGAALMQAFADDKISITGFDGRYPADKRQEAIDRFQEGKARVFLAQQTAAGTGITLTAASEIVLVEPSWSPADNEQAIKRIHRIGQARPCRARIFAQPGTMDEALMATLLRKTKMREGVGL